ncbi:MAG TPA: TetR/AcrR family transcriptional regulator [Ilumatobacteraceae bacterium]|nr:TetR/AcrR family transcriptional regulator [Ilumatobacteraceae bacterium]
MSRLGRPKASDSTETRKRIIDVARRLFADCGYTEATTRMVAEEAGVTSAALYHYYPSKLDLYVAVQLDCRDRVTARIAPAISDGATFVDRAMGLLDATRVMNHEDPTLARFLASARVDVQRRPELVNALSEGGNWWVRMLASIVDHGVATGEIPAEHRELTEAFMLSLLIGLTATATMDAHLHTVAINAVRFALRNSLLTPSGSMGAAKPGAAGGVDGVSR